MLKSINLLVFGLLLSSAAAHASDKLDGYSYCRSYMSNGGFGQPAGRRVHCLEFSEGRMRDGAGTRFGRPPKFYAYSVSGDVVTTRGGGTYELSDDGKTLTSQRGGSVVAGVEFKRRKTR